MMLRPFHPCDLRRIELQRAQHNFYTNAPPDYGDRVLRGGAAHTVTHRGQLIACVGVLDTGDRHMGHVWLFLSKHASNHMVALTRMARRYFDVTAKRLLTATCEGQFEAGHRWLRLLGFEYVCDLPGYGLDGSDHVLYRLYRSVH